MKDFDFGGERYLRTGEILPPGAFEELRTFPAILLGAVGHPDVAPGMLEKGSFWSSASASTSTSTSGRSNCFPASRPRWPARGLTDIDFVVVRENTEDMYVGMGGFLKKNTPDEVAMQTAVYTRKGCERCIRWAFNYTRKRNQKKRLTLVAKTNVLAFGHDFWWRTFQDVAKEYRTSRPTTTTSTPAACGWSRIPNTTT